jgi:integrase
MSRAPVAMTPQELRNLLTVTREQDYRAYVLFLVTVCHGLRVTEAITLRRRDFSVNGSTLYLTVQRLKGSERTTQRLNVDPDSLFDEHSVVGEYIRTLRPIDHLFTTRTGEEMTRWQVTTLIEKYGEKAGVPKHKRFVHALKHTAGLLMRQAGCRIEEIQVALGHKNVNSSMAYLRISTDEADDARARAFAQAASGRMRAEVGTRVSPTLERAAVGSQG